jgi:hypothetical protein
MAASVAQREPAADVPEARQAGGVRAPQSDPSTLVVEFMLGTASLTKAQRVGSWEQTPPPPPIDIPRKVPMMTVANDDNNSSTLSTEVDAW